MKTNILLTGMAAVMATAGMANAQEYRPFVGATIGLQGIEYADATNTNARYSYWDLPDDFMSFGLEAGVRVGQHDQIYNGGVTVNVDFSSESDIEQKFSHIKVADLETFNLTATYDNYIRLSGDKAKRIDLVLGIGGGTMNYRLHTISPLYPDETVYSPVVALKVGVDFELTKNLTLSANTRVFVPTRDNYSIESTYIVGGAVKWLF